MVNRSLTSEGILRLDAAETTLLIGIGGVFLVLLYWGATMPFQMPPNGVERATRPAPVCHNPVEQSRRVRFAMPMSPGN